MTSLSTGFRRVRRVSIVSALSCLFLLLVLPAQATVYYVATAAQGGDDANNGTSTNTPWLTFQNIPANAVAGNSFFIRGGIYLHWDDSIWTQIRLYGKSGTAASPIIISNYPGEVPTIVGSGPNAYQIDVNGSSWIKIFGINVTNGWRAVEVTGSANCEFGYCDWAGGPTNALGGLYVVTLDTGSVSNHFHDMAIHDGPHATDTDAGHGLILGYNYNQTGGGLDWSSNNIIGPNIQFYHNGHDTLSVYTPLNRVIGNLFHNEPWFYATSLQTNAAHRLLEVGGQNGWGVVVRGNRFQDTQTSAAGNPANCVEDDGPGTNRIYLNTIYGAYNGGITLYNGKTEFVNTGYGYDRIFQNTIVSNGLGYPSNIVIYSGGVPVATNANGLWAGAFAFAWTTNNYFRNNLLAGNFINGGQFNGGSAVSTAIADYTGNVTNAAPSALFTSTTDGGPWSTNQPDFHLISGAPAIDAGAYLTAVLSASGSGTNMQVVDGNWFCGDMSAAGYTDPGDIIQLQGQTNTVRVVSVSGNTLTLSGPLTWTLGQGVALAYSGTAPDAGAFEFIGANPPAPPGGGGMYLPFNRF